MTEQAFTRAYNKLLSQLENHSHKDELLNIMSQQILDDTPVVTSQMFKRRST